MPSCHSDNLGPARNSQRDNASAASQRRWYDGQLSVRPFAAGMEPRLSYFECKGVIAHENSGPKR